VTEQPSADVEPIDEEAAGDYIEPDDGQDDDPETVVPDTDKHPD